MGLSSALALSRNALEIYTTGIEVAGQNIANAGTPGYIREELHLSPSSSFRRGQLLVGTGVSANGIRQQIDKFLEVRLHSANTSAANADAVNDIYKQLEATLNELGDGDLSTSLNTFLSGLHDLANEPESIAARELAVQAGEQLARDVRSLRSRVDELRLSQTVAIDGVVSKANSLIQEIASLNPQISRLEAAGNLGSEAGALRSQRYQALTELSELIPIRFTENADRTVDVFSNSDYLILDNQVQTLETSVTVDRLVQVQTVTLSETRSDITRNGGRLAGIAEGRDDVLGGFVDDLDALASAVILEFNRLHSSGQGLDGYTSLTSEYAVDDTTADLDSTTANLPFTPVHGGFEVLVTNTATGQTTTVPVTVDLDGIGGDDGLDDLRAKLDAIGNLSASTSADGRLSLDAADGYEFAFADDTSGVLAALGLNTFFTGTDSSTIGVNSDIASDSRRFAAALGGGPSDGSNALAMTGFAETALTGLDGFSIDAHYRNTVTKLARDSSTRDTVLEGRNDFRESLRAQREQFSGVSVDEEAIKVLQLQHSYQAAARLISTIDELYNTLLTI